VTERAVRVRAPGRVNLIGEHTDYNGGLAAPMAVDRFVDVLYEPANAPTLRVRTDIDPRPVDLAREPAWDPERLRALEPDWARLAGAVLAAVGRPVGGALSVTSTLPVGVGLSSSAAFCVAVALALGADPDPWSMAELCRRAESAVGAPVGLMDPLVSMAGSEGHLLRVDFAARTHRAVPLPPEAEVAVVASGVVRRLTDTPYAERRRECERAAALLGHPLGLAQARELATIADPTLRARARHVIGECERVDAFVGDLESGDLPAAGRRMVESHRSLAADFAASSPEIDALVEQLCATDGVYGARLVGGGFGGNVVVLCRPRSLATAEWSSRAQVLAAAGGARRTEPDEPI
jgi:galactokinase